jgi:gliding motility-associated-like protein
MNTETDTEFVVRFYATSAYGCVDSTYDTLHLVNYISPSFTTTPYPYVCQDSNVVFTNTSISLGTGPHNIATTYMWNFGNATSTLFSPTNTYPRTGTYNITMIQTNFVPCSDTVTQTLTIDTISGMTMLATDTVLCSGQAVTFTGLYASEGNTGNVWGVSDGYKMENLNPILHSFDGAAIYTVTVTAKYRACPEATSSRTIRVYSYPEVYLGPDTSICPGSNAIVLTDDRNQGTAGVSWLWNTGETGPQIAVVKPGDYTVVVTKNGCSTADTVVVVSDCYMDIPNVFSPNGDGVNDYFFPRQLLTRGMIEFSMTIYNRWGQQVYQTTSIDGRGWDGNFNNIPQPIGVYVYIIDATFKDGQVEHHKGNVTLLR